tara:strand:- start:314 stop:532 length:219 start_codon:yes stop_codon:yes gene_type:complete
LINLNPELVEKKDPPIITRIKKTNVRLDCFDSKEKPILEILLVNDKRLIKKSFLKLKKRKKIEVTIIKYIIK